MIQHKQSCAESRRTCEEEVGRLPPGFEEQSTVGNGEPDLSDPELYTARQHLGFEVTHDQLKQKCHCDWSGRVNE